MFIHKSHRLLELPATPIDPEIYHCKTTNKEHFHTPNMYILMEHGKKEKLNEPVCATK